MQQGSQDISRQSKSEPAGLALKGLFARTDAVSGSSERSTRARLRFAVFAGGAFAALLALAWMDGGEEPIHPISSSVPLPASIAGESS